MIDQREKCKLSIKIWKTKLSNALLEDFLKESLLHCFLVEETDDDHINIIYFMV